MKHYELVGRLEFVSELIEFNNFKKIDFVLRVESQHTRDNFIQFQAVNRFYNLLEGVNLHELICVEFILHGRYHKRSDGTEHFYNNLNAIKVKKVDGKSITTSRNNS